jgi:hypothetical protein
MLVEEVEGRGSSFITGIASGLVAALLIFLASE